MTRDIVGSVTITQRAVENILRQLNIITKKNKINNRAISKLQELPQVVQSIIKVTSFLVTANDIQTRIHCIIQGITEQPCCLYCNKPVRIRKSGKFINTFPVFCTSMCSAKHEDTKTKRSVTNIQRYGIDNLLKLSDIRFVR